MSPRIPNFNTLSTIIDRLSIENVKLAYFENALEHDELSEVQRTACQQKIAVQRGIIATLRHELADSLKEVFLKRKYTYLKEERTFTHAPVPPRAGQYGVPPHAQARGAPHDGRRAH